MHPTPPPGADQPFRPSTHYTTMLFSKTSRKVPPGITFTGSILLNWKIVSLPLTLLGIFRPNLWQAILLLLATLPISIAAVVCFRNLRHAKRMKELGAELPPLIPTKSFGGLEVLKGLRWEYHFGYLGNSDFRRERINYRMNTRTVSRRALEWLGRAIRTYNVYDDPVGAPCTWSHCKASRVVC